MERNELLTVAKLAEAWGVPKARLSKRLKEQRVEPDLIKRGCGYYSLPKLEKVRPKLGF